MPPKWLVPWLAWLMVSHGDVFGVPSRNCCTAATRRWPAACAVLEGATAGALLDLTRLASGSGTFGSAGLGSAGDGSADLVMASTGRGRGNGLADTDPVADRATTEPNIGDG